MQTYTQAQIDEAHAIIEAERNRLRNETEWQDPLPLRTRNALGMANIRTMEQAREGLASGAYKRWGIGLGDNFRALVELVGAADQLYFTRQIKLSLEADDAYMRLGAAGAREVIEKALIMCPTPSK